jgi:hypothetical protein
MTSALAVDDPWLKSSEEVLKKLQTDRKGLTDEQVKTNAALYGPNGEFFLGVFGRWRACVTGPSSVLGCTRHMCSERC